MVRAMLCGASFRGATALIHYRHSSLPTTMAVAVFKAVCCFRDSQSNSWTSRSRRKKIAGFGGFARSIAY
eukprot:scaffold971_cov107-Isochrysis_galbana.AAC.7